jgi:hypothetical protein
MSSTSFTVSPIENSDLPAVSRNLAASKLPLTINRLLYKNWPNEEAQLAQCTKTIEGAFKNPLNVLFLKAIDNKSGEIVGHIAVTHKSAGDTKLGPGISVGEDAKPIAPDGMNEDVFRAVIQSVAEISTHQDVEHLGKTCPILISGSSS